MYQNIAVSVGAGLLLLFMREAPEHPPSHNSMRKEKSVDFSNGYRHLVANTNFLVLLAIFAILMGVFQTFGSLLGSLFEPFGLSPSFIAVHGALLLISGIVVSPIVGSLVGKYKKYLLSLRILIGILAATFCSSLVMINNLEDY